MKKKRNIKKIVFYIIAFYLAFQILIPNYSNTSIIYEEEIKNAEENTSTKYDIIINDSNNTSNKDETKPKENLTVHFIDVGQGDAIFVELPNNETMLIDAGESSKEKVVFNYIKKYESKYIDYLIGTHPHADHIGSLAYIINNFDIGKIYMPKAISTTRTYENLLTTILNKKLKVNRAKAGVNILDSDNLKINIIAPNKENYSDLNDFSAVIEITYCNNKFLFMGDAGIEIENELTKNLKADVIKIGHHGSNTSSSKSFVNKVQAKYAIITVGNKNKYNHPYEEIIERWKNIGAKIYRTDLNGNIIVTSDGNKIEITTEK